MDPESIVIQQITTELCASYHDCVDSVARERRYLGSIEAPPLEKAYAFMDRLLADGMPFIVAVGAGKVVGWCDISRATMAGAQHCGHLGMGVLAGYRGMGLGGRLMLSALETAKSAGIERVNLSVFSTNEPAIALYKKLGFEVEGLHRNARKLDGITEDIIDMALFLVPQ